jgi:hypothetical protein
MSRWKIIGVPIVVDDETKAYIEKHKIPIPGAVCEIVGFTKLIDGKECTIRNPSECSGCAAREHCEYYISQFIKPPLGITPRFILEEKRLQEIIEGIDRRVKATYEIPIEWIEEYNMLVNKIKK